MRLADELCEVRELAGRGILEDVRDEVAEPHSPPRHGGVLEQGDGSASGEFGEQRIDSRDKVI